jgi:tetratricopeptide (TPR) repeat protein
MWAIRGFVSVVVCSLVLATAAHAVRADPSQGAIAFDEGRRLFQSGDYRGALAAFKKGYLSTEDASFLLNIAQCHRFLMEPKEAVMMYRLYLKSSPEGANTEARSVATKAILEIERELAAQPSPTTPVVPLSPAAPNAASPTPTPATAAVPPGRSLGVSAPSRGQGASPYPVLDPQPGVAIQRLPEAPPASATNAASLRRLRVAGVACASAGLVSLGAGVYYWTRATSLSDTANKATAYNQSDYDQGNRAETMQWIFYSVGAAAAATGVVLYLYGSSSPTETKTGVSLVPMVGPGATGLYAHGAF